MESDTFYEDFMVKLVGIFCGVFKGGNMVNQITEESPYQFHH